MSDGTDKPVSPAMPQRLRAVFWQPPRAHGEIIENRAVSFLELFYDLVYVVVIAQATHHLAEHVTWRGVGEFAVIFGMIWIAWLNGTLYQDLHGRDDGRSRVFIFVQMILLALLAVFTGDAAGAGGQGFALVYTVFLVVITWLWYCVRLQDAPEYMALTKRYLTSIVASTVLIGISVFLSDDVRVVVWGLFIVVFVVGSALIERTDFEGREDVFGATESLVERFGLFTIIVLGEVVVGVVTGLSDVARDLQSTATGIIGLMIGFGIWWTYFDFVGRRTPRPRGGTVVWMIGHLPVSMAIAASGAALVSLIEHAGDERAPAASAWLLTGSVAMALMALVVVMRSLADYPRLPAIYRPLTGAIVAAAAAALVVGWLRPAPWLLVISIVVILTAVWWLAVDRWLRMDDPSEARPT
jgi:low temperature requirement protein LtrA